MNRLKEAVANAIKAEVRAEANPELKKQLADKVRKSVDRDFNEHDPSGDV